MSKPNTIQVDTEKGVKEYVSLDSYNRMKSRYQRINEELKYRISKEQISEEDFEIFKKCVDVYKNVEKDTIKIEGDYEYSESSRRIAETIEKAQNTLNIIMDVKDMFRKQ